MATGTNKSSAKKTSSVPSRISVENTENGTIVEVTLERKKEGEQWPEMTYKKFNGPAGLIERILSEISEYASGSEEAEDNTEAKSFNVNTFLKK